MSTSDALTLRLPSWLCESFDLSRVIANEHRSAGRTAGVCRRRGLDSRVDDGPDGSTTRLGVVEPQPGGVGGKPLTSPFPAGSGAPSATYPPASRT